MSHINTNAFFWTIQRAPEKETKIYKKWAGFDGVCIFVWIFERIEFLWPVTYEDDFDERQESHFAFLSSRLQKVYLSHYQGKNKF